MTARELTQEEAVEHAARWVEAYVDHDEDALGMSADELSALLGWVRRRMATDLADLDAMVDAYRLQPEKREKQRRLLLAMDVGEELAIGSDQDRGPAWALCEAARWPS